MTTYPWPVFFVLLAAGSIGVATILPYAFALNREKLEQAPLSRPVLVAVSLLQSIILTAIATGLGLLLAGQIGLGAPVIESTTAGQSILPKLLDILPLSIIVGIITGTVMILLDGLFHPYLPEALRKADPRISIWKRLLVPFYGGINEELLLRLFGVSLIAWLLGHIGQTPAGTPTVGVFWIAIIGAALLFGIGHLPATAAITRLTPVVIARGLILNGLGGLVFGYLYWQHGLETAIIAHMSADVILHIIAPAFSHPEAEAHQASVTP